MLVVLPQLNLSHFVCALCFALWLSELRALVFFRQAQNCHILDPLQMMEGFLCCSLACHCEEEKNPLSSLFFPRFRYFSCRGSRFLFLGEQWSAVMAPKMCLPLYKQWRGVKKRRHHVTINLPFPYREFFLFLSSPLASSHAEWRADRYSRVKLSKTKFLSWFLSRRCCR